ncbi:MAG: RNA-guided endonuclease InsQ/TnpB family protein, partial [Ktedonobacterales bacterium]
MATTSVRKTYQYKLMPTPAQEQALETVLQRCRTLYNVALEQRKTWWQRGQGKSGTYYQQANELPDLKGACPDYVEVNAQVLQDVLRRLDKTFQAFFRRVKNGETPRAAGYPRFQGKDRYHSFTYPQYGGGAVLDGGVLSLSKIGRIPLRLHRPLEGTPKTVTISKEADGWYVSFSCAEVPTQPLPLTGRETGIDVGLKVFLITAEGEQVENPRHYRKAEKQLAKAQKRVSRRKKGSNRRKKAVAQCAKKHQHVRRQRSDFQHKTALALVRQYDVIYHEAIQPTTLNRRPAPKPDPDKPGSYLHNGAARKAGLNKSIQDASWGCFLTLLTFKAACAGKRVEAVNPAYTTQDCSGCGERVPKSLSVRTHVCPSCGLVMDRDENAARNIVWRGQRLRGLAGIPAGTNREAPSLSGWGAGHFDVESFAGAGLCRVTRKATPHSQVMTYWMPPEPELSPLPYPAAGDMAGDGHEGDDARKRDTLDRVRNAWLEVTWEEARLDVLILN